MELHQRLPRWPWLEAAPGLMHAQRHDRGPGGSESGASAATTSMLPPCVLHARLDLEPLSGDEPLEGNVLDVGDGDFDFGRLDDRSLLPLPLSFPTVPTLPIPLASNYTLLGAASAADAGLASENASGRSQYGQPRVAAPSPRPQAVGPLPSRQPPSPHTASHSGAPDQPSNTNHASTTGVVAGGGTRRRRHRPSLQRPRVGLDIAGDAGVRGTAHAVPSSTAAVAVGDSAALHVPSLDIRGLLPGRGDAGSAAAVAVDSSGHTRHRVGSGANLTTTSSVHGAAGGTSTPSAVVGVDRVAAISRGVIVDDDDDDDGAMELATDDAPAQASRQLGRSPPHATTRTTVDAVLSGGDDGTAVGVLPRRSSSGRRGSSRTLHRCTYPDCSYTSASVNNLSRHTRCGARHESRLRPLWSTAVPPTVWLRLAVEQAFY